MTHGYAVLNEQFATVGESRVDDRLCYRAEHQSGGPISSPAGYPRHGRQDASVPL
jgi:hypothetical protein